MFNSRKIEPNKIKDNFNKRLMALAENTFLTFLGLFIISLILGAIIFIHCSTLIKMPAESVGEEKVFKFEVKTYQKVLEDWQVKNERFSQIETKKYINPFSH